MFARGVHVLSQVHSENMDHEKSSLARNDRVIDDDAAVNSKLPSGAPRRVSTCTDADSYYGLGSAGWRVNR